MMAFLSKADSTTSRFPLHGLYFQLTAGILLVCLGIGLGGWLFKDTSDYAVNLYTDVMNLCATVFVIDLLARRREEQRERQARYRRLVFEAGSSSNDTAKRAIDELRYGDQLRGTGSLLRGAVLRKADWQDAHLKDSNLQDTILAEARLANADLSYTNLTHSNLNSADLTGANLHGADLSRADLYGARLCQASIGYTSFIGADLSCADLRGADLTRSNLQGANLEGALFDSETILPDGTRWHPDMPISDHFRWVE